MNDEHDNGRDEPLDAAEPEADQGADAPDASAEPLRGHPAAALHELTREELERELQQARAEIERLQDQALRRQADLINFRRRAQKENAESVMVGQGKVLEQIVPVVDDFQRAVNTEAVDASAYHEGMELILRSLHKALEQLGVERIEPHGKPFDPRYHEAVARHRTDEVPDGHVLDVFHAGYRLRDRLIRPAAVVVAFGGASGAAPADDDGSAAGGLAAGGAGGNEVGDDG
jgi:molecular chaperone GrpE